MPICVYIHIHCSIPLGDWLNTSSFGLYCDFIIQCKKFSQPQKVNDHRIWIIWRRFLQVSFLSKYLCIFPSYAVVVALKTQWWGVSYWKQKHLLPLLEFTTRHSKQCSNVRYLPFDIKYIYQKRVLSSFPRLMSDCFHSESRVLRMCGVWGVREVSDVNATQSVRWTVHVMNAIQVAYNTGRLISRLRVLGLILWRSRVVVQPVGRVYVFM